ncbi:peptidoglycan DD-metalloendopeptidase family protein [Arenimonas sp. MALMAid1274]|uniref:peptidoglycan DD-metalloendopeptidase family protein n=1 Tax=Arenimonas sp. MALMAid1274 TaxID=3411630 RepID=UPI003BA184B2
MRWLRAALVGLVVVGLAACGQSRVVKREGSRPSPPSRVASQAAPRSGDYLVRAGDTLYGIAFRHGLDYREVAAWNRIPAPYTIYPGQRLKLRGAAASVARGPAPRPATTSESSSGQALPPRQAPVQGGFVTVSPTPTPSPSPAGAPVAAVPSSAPAIPSQAPVVPAPSATAVTPVVSPTVPAVSAPALPGPAAAVSAAGWRWPTQGALIGRFLAGDPKRQGIDIAGVAGQPVVAAADGVVVYSGAGLVGYGELIIIKHNDEWLSAYAHSRRRLVGEGTAVKAGQTIAELGRTGTSRDMLHFEVRRNGKPVDPLTLLPAQ